MNLNNNTAKGNLIRKATIIYVIGQFIIKGVNFLLIPLYTHKLGTAGFGQLSLIDMIYSFITIFITIGIGSGYTRFYNEYKSKEEKEILKNTTITFALVLAIIITILGTIFSPIYSSHLLQISNSNVLMFLLLVRCATDQIIYILLIEYSMTYNAKKVVFVETLKVILNTVLIIILIDILKNGVMAIYMGYVVGNIPIIIYLFITQRRNFQIKINIKMLKKMSSYSIQLIPSGLSSVVLNLADRYVIEYFCGLSTTGIYSLGYKIGMLIDPVFIDPFRKTFTPFKFSVCHDEDANKKLSDKYEIYNVLGISIIFLISIFSKTLIGIISTPAFIDAYKIIPLILISYFIYGKSQFYSLGMHVSNKTYYDAYVMIVGGILNIILNIILVRYWGMYGATLSTVLSYYVMNILYKKVSNKLSTYEFKITSKTIFMYIISAVIYLLYFVATAFIKNPILELLLEFIIVFLWLLLLDRLKIIKVKNVWLNYLRR